MIFSKLEWAEMVTGMMANDKFIQESSRCVYENDDILVTHNYMSYPDENQRSSYECFNIKRWTNHSYGNWRNIIRLGEYKNGYN